MKKAIMIATLMAVCSMSYATVIGSGCQGNCANKGSGGTQTTSQSQDQTQYQGQVQIQSSTSNAHAQSSSKSTSNSNATGGNASSTATGGHATATGGSSSAKGGNATGGAGGNATGGSTSSSNNAVMGVAVQGNERSVAGSYAPTVAPTALCMGSTSAGAQGLTFGVSVGGSWTDNNCMLLEQVRTVSAVLGDRNTAAEMMCAVPAYREARSRVGNPCIGTVVTAPAAQNVQYTDPLVRARLNLPPLQ